MPSLPCNNVASVPISSSASLLCDSEAGVEEEEVFYRLLLLLLSYGTILAVERQTWCGTAPACRESIKHLYGALGDADTAVTTQTLAAKSHPFESNTLHLLPFEHLRNLVATHPAAVGVEGSNHVWDPFFVGLPCQQNLASSQSSLKGLSDLSGGCLLNQQL
ncbi:TPA: hypothetical protein ACH3X1_007692 [Trebouxia sp. C0004]